MSLSSLSASQPKVEAVFATSVQIRFKNDCYAVHVYQKLYSKNFRKCFYLILSDKSFIAVLNTLTVVYSLPSVLFNAWTDGTKWTNLLQCNCTCQLRSILTTGLLQTLDSLLWDFCRLVHSNCYFNEGEANIGPLLDFTALETLHGSKNIRTWFCIRRLVQQTTLVQYWANRLSNSKFEQVVYFTWL